MKLSGFPSPCGDYGSYRDHILEEKRHDRKLFPSPCGDYGSYRTPCFPGENHLSQVSVPLRGLWFLSTKAERDKWVDEHEVSVPLRGLWFLSLFVGRFYHERTEKFPSPCGDYGSYLTI